MLRNEIHMFFSRKNILVLAGAVIAILLIYQFQYKKAYEEYGVKETQRITNQEAYLKANVKLNENSIAYYEENEPENENFPKVKKMYNIWQTQYGQRLLIRDLWEDWKPYEDNRKIEEIILRRSCQMDQALEESINIQLGEGEWILFDGTRRDWNERMLLHNAYKEAGIEEPVNKATPTGAYVLWEALKGGGQFFVVFIIVLILWNYNIWSADFDEETYKLLYTLPYSRGKIFRVRCFVHCGLSVLGIGVLLLTLFLRGTVSFGTGLDGFRVINQRAISLFSVFFIGSGQTEVGDIALSMPKVIEIQFSLVVLFFLCFIAIIQFISFALKNSTSVVCVLTALVTAIGTVNLLSSGDEYGEMIPILERLNPFSYFKVAEIVHGDFGLGVPIIVLEEIGIILILFIVTRVWMKHREM